MESNKTIVPIEYYNLDRIPDGIHIIHNVNVDQETTIKNMFWFPNPEIIERLVSFCKINNYSKILEIGPGVSPFPLATTFVGFNEKVPNYIDIDIDKNPLPFKDKEFDFVYCRHVLEDIQNPDFALSEIKRVAKSFYIETPSPLVEITKGVDAPQYSNQYCGYMHHRYIIWYEETSKTVHMLPKLGIIETLLFTSEKLQNKINYLLNNFPVYWNSYLFCENPDEITIKMYNHFKLDQYVNLLEEAIATTIQNVNSSVNKINNFKK